MVAEKTLICRNKKEAFLTGRLYLSEQAKFPLPPMFSPLASIRFAYFRKLFYRLPNHVEAQKNPENHYFPRNGNFQMHEAEYFADFAYRLQR